VLFSVFGLLSGSEQFSVPIAGTGVLFGALAFFLLMGGALSELIYKTGDLRPGQLSSLTSRLLMGKGSGGSGSRSEVKQSEQLD